MRQVRSGHTFIVMAGEACPGEGREPATTSFMYSGRKDVEGGVNPRHDDVQRAVPITMHLFPHES